MLSRRLLQVHRQAVVSQKEPPRRDRSRSPVDKTVIIDLRPCPECGEEGEYDPDWLLGACPECRMVNRFPRPSKGRGKGKGQRPSLARPADAKEMATKGMGPQAGSGRGGQSGNGCHPRYLVIPQCRLTVVFHEIVRTHQKLEKHLENASLNKC